MMNFKNEFKKLYFVIIHVIGFVYISKISSKITIVTQEMRRQLPNDKINFINLYNLRAQIKNLGELLLPVDI